MARKLQQIESAFAGLDEQGLQATVRALPPGYISGFVMTVGDDAEITIGPGIAHVAGTEVIIEETHTLTEEDWVVNKIGSGWFFVYLTKGGFFKVGFLEPVWDGERQGYYEPYQDWRSVGRLYVDAGVITRAVSAEEERLKVTYNLLKAYDEIGTVIHDIPDAPVLSGMFYFGHYIAFEAVDFFGAHNMSQNDYASSWTETSPTQNESLATLTKGLGNIKGALVALNIMQSIGASKVLDISKIRSIVRVSTTYDTAPGNYNRIGGYYTSSQANNEQFRFEGLTNVPVPVVYNGTTPYMTWSLYVDFQGMDAIYTSIYSCQATFYLLGVFV